MSRSHALPPFCCHTSDWGGAASKLSIWRTLGKNNFFARQFSVNFQWGLMYICKVHRNTKEGKEISRPNKVMVCSPSGRLHFVGSGESCTWDKCVIYSCTGLTSATYLWWSVEGQETKDKNVGQLSRRAYNGILALHKYCRINWYESHRL